jgi:hypothetical protein
MMTANERTSAVRAFCHLNIGKGAGRMGINIFPLLTQNLFPFDGKI